VSQQIVRRGRYEVRAEIQQIGRFWWFASYTAWPVDDGGGIKIGLDYSELGSFAFTEKGIQRKAERKIRRLQRSEDRRHAAYDFGRTP